ncbi:hypothetical protein KRR38_05130 [Novosphingobium sp. G106]|uniref:hypothetical protein n=1 Tax=Novosphingobium sp. G106 TaxID=2849500 RepID=UPI001C2D34E0|nr:hypothetical protein [Novosphingobium sp. G106]MBV1687069.1 hypothetical protein [Novosphingobium sp. G106]
MLLTSLVALQPVLLGGCVAAVAPVLAGTLVIKTRIDGKPDGKPKGEHRKSTLAKSGKPPPLVAEPLARRIAPIAGTDTQMPAGTSLQLTGLTALPRPDEAPGAIGGSFAAFGHFALTAAQPKPGQPVRSALIDPATLTSRPARANCGNQPPAVLIDLDPDKAVFDLDDPPAAAPGLAEQLARLRAAGITILWQASLPTDKSERLYIILAAVGLDPDRTDRLLLIRKPDERKQDRRQDAARDWCILAVAGDSKGDFEEAFDYLRDPNGILASAMSANLGDGWFLTPQPIR